MNHGCDGNKLKAQIHADDIFQLSHAVWEVSHVGAWWIVNIHMKDFQFYVW